MVKVDIQAHQRQEEEQDREEEDHLPQEEAKEEAQCRGEPHHTHQEEEQAIQDLLHLYLQVFNNLHVLQIHGVPLDRSRESPSKADATLQLQGLQHLGNETVARDMV